MKFSQEELEIVKKYHDLAALNPNVVSGVDEIAYIFVKIMFEHPLADGNKRLATKYLLKNLNVSEVAIDAICESLAKENA